MARHEKDFLTVDDTWFRGLELKYGPDGAVYLTDWYDTGECHETDSDNAHRENGRIYKISFGKAAAVKVDLSAESDLALARYQLHANDWYARTARRLLQERRAAGKDLGEASRLLREIFGIQSGCHPASALRSGRCTQRAVSMRKGGEACSKIKASTFVPGQYGCTVMERRRKRT